jgi:hypothetical protein
MIHYLVIQDFDTALIDYIILILSAACGITVFASAAAHTSGLAAIYFFNVC